MKKAALLGGTILILYFLQISFFRMIAINQIQPNGLILGITLFAFLRGEYDGVIIGALLGLLVDLFYSSFLGFHFFIFGAIGLLAGRSYYIFAKDNFMLPLLMIGFADFSYHLSVYFIGFLFRGNMEFFHFLVTLILPEMVYTVLIGAILYHPVIWLNQRLSWLAKKTEERL